MWERKGQYGEVWLSKREEKKNSEAVNKVVGIELHRLRAVLSKPDTSDLTSRAAGDTISRPESSCNGSAQAGASLPLHRSETVSLF